MITLTTSAAEKIREIMERENRTEYRLRMGVQGESCCGMQYVLGFDLQNTEDDHVFSQSGINMVCDAQSFKVLDGTEIDFLEDERGTGFVFNNPNKPNGCGGHCSEGCAS